MKNIQEKIKICLKCPASNCPKKKALEKESRFKIHYHWKKVAGGWSKLLGGKIKKVDTK